MVVDTVGFDFDDVIVDTFANVAMKVEEASRMLGFPRPSNEAIAHAYDYGNEMCKKLFPQQADEFWSVYKSLDFPYMPMDGMMEAIEHLSNNGIEPWIFTGSRNQGVISTRLRQAGIDPACFRLIVTRQETHPYRKPDKNAWERCAQCLSESGIDLARSLYVEDGLENYLRAKEIGLRAVLLLGSPNSRSYQGNLPESDVLPSMREFSQLLISRGSVLGDG